MRDRQIHDALFDGPQRLVPKPRSPRVILTQHVQRSVSLSLFSLFLFHSSICTSCGSVQVSIIIAIIITIGYFMLFMLFNVLHHILCAIYRTCIIKHCSRADFGGRYCASLSQAECNNAAKGPTSMITLTTQNDIKSI